MENRWEKGQGQMSSEQLEDFRESGEGDGHLDRGGIVGNTKGWTDPENQKKHDNWTLWDVRGGNINSIFRALDGGW